MRNKYNKYIISLIAILAIGCAKKQISPSVEMLPFSDEITVGQLDNGFKYYIKSNDYPKDRIEMILNVRTGSLNENDDEQGLAHFVEHMAFNGTENFSGNEIIKFMEEAGITFGQHVNASTSYDVTKYILSIPSKDKDLFAKTLFIMREWADNVSITKEQVDLEIPVILEEKRSRESSQQRLRDQALNYTFTNSKLINRAPIGIEEVIVSATPEKLQKYYDNWYVPNNMSIVIIGDIDVNEVENAIKYQFSSMEKKEMPTPAERTVPVIDGIRTLVITDEEVKKTSVSMVYYFKQNSVDTYAELKDYFLSAGATGMLSNRVVNKITEQRSDLLSFSARHSLATDANERGSFSLSINTKPETLNDDVRKMLIEVESVKRHGYNQDEIDNFATRQMTQINNYASGEYKYPSSSYANNLAVYDAFGGHVTTFQQDKIYTDRIFAETSANDYQNKINELLNHTSILLIVTTPPEDVDKITLDKEMLEKIMSDVKTAEIEKEEIVAEITSLINNEPKMAKVVSREKFNEIGGELITYENGAKIFIKQNMTIPNKYDFSGVKIGGTSILSDEDARKISLMPDIISASGFNNITKKQLDRYLADKNASVDIKSSAYAFQYAGSGDTKDIEVGFQRLYKYFNSATVDENIFDVLIKNRKLSMEATEKNVNTQYSRKVSKMIYNDEYRRQYLYSSELDNITTDDMMRLFNEHYKDINNFMFVFVGDIDTEKVIELGAKYLGSIKSNKQPEKIILRDLKFRNKKGSYQENIQVQNRANISVLIEGKFEEIENGRSMSSMARRILGVRLRESIREDMGGVYSINTDMSYSELPKFKRSTTVSFSCSPERTDEIVAEVFNIIDNFAKNGITQDELDIAYSQLITAYDTSSVNNSFWMGKILRYLIYNERIETNEQTKARYTAVTVDELNAYIKEFYDDYNSFVSIINPK